MVIEMYGVKWNVFPPKVKGEEWTIYNGDMERPARGLRKKLKQKYHELCNPVNLIQESYMTSGITVIDAPVPTMNMDFTPTAVTWGGLVPCNPYDTVSYWNSLGPLQTTAKCEPVQEKGNKQMHTYANNAEQFAIEQRNFLFGKLSSAFTEKDFDLRKAFHLMDDDRPTSVKEFVQRIKDGKFTLPKDWDEEQDEDDCYFDLSDFVYALRWRDPAVKEDKAGYKAARETLSKAYDDAATTVMLKSLDDGLKAVEDFKAQTFH